MDSFWRGPYNAAEGRLPVEILTAQAKTLSHLTEGKVYAEVKAKPGVPIHRIAAAGVSDSQFVYSMYLRSRNVPTYFFCILSVFHGVTIYPVTVLADIDIHQQVKVLSHNARPAFHTGQGFKSVLRDVLSSEKLTEIIMNLMRLSRASVSPGPGPNGY